MNAGLVLIILVFNIKAIMVDLRNVSQKATSGRITPIMVDSVDGERRCGRNGSTINP
jgi:hypothetical protein